jgi:SEFIR domain.
VVTEHPKAFISYSWDSDTHKSWVSGLAARLRSDGVNAMLDQWENAPGDQLPAFMERAVRENQHVLIICTPRYRERSDTRVGGVGYEGDIMAAEVMVNRDHRKFIPLLREGAWDLAAPSWLKGKYHLDFSGEPYPARSYDDLISTFYGRLPAAPPLGPVPARFRAVPSSGDARATTAHGESIRIKGVLVDQVSEPRRDGTRGSALYKVPLQLSAKPSPEWAQLFVETWNHPPRFTTMHRPGIARVVDDRIVLDGTTLEEIEKYHRDTLVLVVGRVNQQVAADAERRESARQRESEASADRRRRVEDISRRLKFDDQ